MIEKLLGDITNEGLKDFINKYIMESYHPKQLKVETEALTVSCLQKEIPTI